MLKFIIATFAIVLFAISPAEAYNKNKHRHNNYNNSFNNYVFNFRIGGVNGYRNYYRPGYRNYYRPGYRNYYRPYQRRYYNPVRCWNNIVGYDYYGYPIYNRVCVRR